MIEQSAFTGGNPSTGELASPVTPDWLNSVNEELNAAATMDGDALGTSNNQLKQVIERRDAAYAALLQGQAEIRLAQFQTWEFLYDKFGEYPA